MVLETDSDVAAQFRHSMRGLAGSVAILTTARDGVAYGITITAVMSLSLTPPALTIAVNKNASIAEPLLARGSFCVNLLHQRHEGFCRLFATGSAQERIASGAYACAKRGLPYIADAQSAIFCSSGPTIDFGTHHLIIGVVEEVINTQCLAPLIYFDGDYAAAQRSNDAAIAPGPHQGR